MTSLVLLLLGVAASFLLTLGLDRVCRAPHARKGSKVLGEA